jgi:hypothetical protein
MKFELGQVIFYMMDNKVHSAPVLSRKCVENAHDDWISNEGQRKTFTPFGQSGNTYSTCHGEISEDDAYESKEQMMHSICFGG